MGNIEESRKDRVLDFVNREDFKKITVKQLAVIFGVPKEDVRYLEKLVLDLEKQGLIYLDDSKRICKIEQNNKKIGIFETKAYSFGFVRVPNGEDIYVSHDDAKGAYDGDTVLIDIIKEKTTTKNAEGSVIKIIKRANLPVAGIFKKGENFGFVEPAKRGIEDIYIPKKYAVGVPNDARVTVRIEKYAALNRKAEGKIIEVLGSQYTKDIERTLLVKSSLIKDKFPDNVLKEAQDVSDLGIGDISSRVDLRKENIYTIDSEDTKDIDDAVSICRQPDGTYKLGVHIADVSHYVQDNSFLDKEAIERGTSTYMPGLVIPMLPRELSNGICSLNEGEDRLTLSIDMILDDNAKVIFSNVYKSVICSKKKMTYEKVEKVLSGSDVEVLKEYRNFEHDIFLMRELAYKLKANRKKNGSIDFDIPETKIELDDLGNVVSVAPYEIGVSNGIIEEFMLVANKCIAKTFLELNAPFIYRVHEKPDIDVLRVLNEVLTNFGVSIKGINKIHPRAVGDALNKAKQDESKSLVVSKLVLRSLKIAKYSHECLGHFGLNFEYYTHFTSPIRRYPDLFIHRVISEYIESGYNVEEKKLAKLYKQAKEYAVSSSVCEKRSTLLERDVDEMYMAKFMENKIGAQYTGVVSGVNNYGMYVKLDNTIEGLVPMVNLLDDYYIYDEKNIRLMGEKTKKIYAIGDKVNVVVQRADAKLRQIDFELAEDKNGSRKYNQKR